jgi:putative ABC transport system permease protein
MAPLARPAPAVPWKWALLGAALAGIDPLLTFSPLDAWLSALGLDALAARHREIRFYGHFTVGLPGVLLGSFLLAPLMVWMFDRTLAPLLARLLGVQPRLLRQQLSGGLWRAAGTGAALMVGLSILIVMQSQGRSGLAAWRLPALFPDVFVYSTVGGIDEPSLERIARMPGVVGGRASIMPIGVFAPQFASNVFGLAGMAFMPDSTTFIAVDPERVFDLMGLEFRQGDPESAKQMLRRGRHLLVTEELSRLKGLSVGSPFELKTPDGTQVRYTVAGVIWSPGIEIMVAAFDMRKQFDQRSAASVFGTLDDARRDFGKTRFEMVTVNLDPSLRRFDFLHQLRNDLGGIGLAVADVRTLKREIVKKMEQLLALGSTVAWSAMLVASLGVTNAVVAGVRTRRWQFGVLRSVGVTRSTLLRMVLAESLLLGLVGAALGVLAGLLMAVNAWRFYDIVLGFRPPLTLPWDMIAVGAGVVVVSSLLASLAPAVSTARSDVLSLLQSGRSAA